MSRTGPALWPSAIRIFDLSLGRMLWSRRSVFLAVLVGGPVALALGIRLAQLAGLLFAFDAPRGLGATLYGFVVWLAYARFVVPVLGVFYGTSFIADEVDDKTLTYLFTRPIKRSAVIVGKYMAYLVCTVLLALPSLVIVFFLVVPIGGSSIGGMFPFLLADLAMVAAGLAAYGAAFAFVGARLKRPLLAGLLFAFGWEPAVLLTPGYLKHATVAYYLQGLIRHQMPLEGPVTAVLQAFREVPSVPVALAGLVAIVALGLWLAAWTVERREYVLEQ